MQLAGSAPFLRVFQIDFRVGLAGHLSPPHSNGNTAAGRAGPRRTRVPGHGDERRPWHAGRVADTNERLEPAAARVKGGAEPRSSSRLSARYRPGIIAAEEITEGGVVSLADDLGRKVAPVVRDSVFLEHLNHFLNVKRVAVNQHAVMSKMTPAGKKSSASYGWRKLRPPLVRSAPLTLKRCIDSASSRQRPRATLFRRWPQQSQQSLGRTVFKCFASPSSHGPSSRALTQ